MKTPNQKGFALAILLVTVLFVSLSIVYVTSLSLTTYNLSTRDIYKSNAQMTADAALDQAMTTLNTVGTTGLSSTLSAEQAFLTQGSLTTTYQTALIDGTTTDRKVLSVISRTKINSSTKITRRYELDVQAVTSGSGPSSVVTGVGGLILNNNSRITGGDVVVNGTITLNNNSQIGLSTTPLANAVNIRVAHTNCPFPVNATYPRVCASGENGQPITNNGQIYADVRATNQTTATNMSNPGLIPNQTVAPVSLPDYDRNAQKAAAVLTDGSGNPYTSTHSAIACGNNQTRTWPANVKITGNITMGNNCTINLSGNVWLTGNLTYGNNARIVVPSSAGTTPPVIMVDGSTGITISNNGTVTVNNVGTGVYFIAYWSAAACSPDCATVTGTDLANSQNQVRVNLANNGSAPGSILYARWSRSSVSNNGAIGAVAGQSILLGNNAVINFTASVPGSNNQTTSWAKRGYMRVYQ